MREPSILFPTDPTGPVQIFVGDIEKIGLNSNTISILLKDGTAYSYAAASASQASDMVDQINSVCYETNQRDNIFTIQDDASPLAPSGLSVTPDYGQAALSWGSVSNVLGYHLKRSLTSGGGYVTIYEGTGTSFTDSENVIGQIYYYVVTAYNNSGESPVSSEVNSQTLVPDAPTSPVSTASYYQSQLSWSAPAVCSSPDSYNIYRSLTSGSGYSLIGNTSDATYNDSGLTAGIEYFYVITAVKGGIEGAQSSEVSDTPTSLDAPTTPAATPGYYNNALTWDSVSGATGYNIKRATVTGGPYTLIGRSETNSFTDSKLRYDTTYFYIITSTVNGGESLASTEVSGQPNQATLSGYSPAPMSVGGGDINFTGTGFNSSQGGQIAYGTPTVYVGVTYNSDGSITATLDSGFTPGVFNMYYVVASDLNISTTNHIAVTFA